MFRRIILCFLLTLNLASCGLGGVKKEKVNNLPKKSFIYIEINRKIEACFDGKCASFSRKGSGSGFVIKKTKNFSYFLTAAHVCEDKKLKSISKLKVTTDFSVRNYEGESSPAEVIKLNHKSDICLMKTKLKNVEEVEIAEVEPVAGVRIVNISAPKGIRSPKMVPIFDGRYIGERDGVSYFTFPSAPGASGSMILSKDGKVISLMHSILIAMDQIVLGTTLKDIKLFLEDFTILNKSEDLVDSLVP